MDDKELIAVLKSEMLLAQARAEGARDAYRWRVMCLARKDLPFRYGEKIVIKFSDGDLLAVLDDLRWAGYELRDYEGPALFGRRLLKSGKPSKHVEALCSIDMVRNGHVKPSNSCSRRNRPVVE